MANRRAEYEKWKRLVDRNLDNLVGFDSEWLPDAPYSRWYQEGKSPLQAAIAALRWATRY